MIIDGVYSLREFCNENFRDVVFEWEEDISSFCHNSEIKCIKNPRENFCSKLINTATKRFSFKNNSDRVKLAFCMNIYEACYYNTKRDVLPVFIDLWPENIKKCVAVIGRSFAVITSLDMYNLLLPYCPNIIYMPLCISDRWVSEMPQKEDIIVQIGRNNPVLQNYAIKYCRNHSSINYIYAEYNPHTKHLTYFSTINGQVGTPETRLDYMRMLKKAKISLCSSPGIDGTRPMAGGIDYPTPRFYESAINFCHILARYHEEHKEFGIQGIDMICHNIKSYEQFEILCDEIFSGKRVIDKKNYDFFIDNHLTSKWLHTLTEKI